MRITIAALDLATEPRIVRDEAGVIIALAEEREVVEAIVSETQRYSITPTTFLEREFEERVDNWWYIDRYGVGDNIAVRFGINSETREVAEAITRLPRDMGVSSSGNTYKLRDAKKIMLSMIEEQLLQKAIRYLMESPQHHAALVDILVRENGGANNGAVKQVDGVPETHTVVLYKNPTAHDEVAADLVVAAAFAATDIQPILVIDPNNFLFSSHLSNLGNGAAYLGCKIVTVHLKTQIYTPNLEVGIGPLQSQYRDCINIAVQIARGLNETMPDLIGTASDATALDALITGCLAIRSLSNSTDIDKNIMVGNNTLLCHVLAILWKIPNEYQKLIFNSINRELDEDEQYYYDNFKENWLIYLD